MMPRTRSLGNDHSTTRDDLDDTRRPGPVRHLKGQGRPGTALAAVRGRNVVPSRLPPHVPRGRSHVDHQNTQERGERRHRPGRPRGPRRRRQGRPDQDQLRASCSARHVAPACSITHRSAVGRARTGSGEIVAGLLALATHHKRWIRPVEEWEPTGTSPLPRFSSLARHLLAAYPVPHFMTSVWLEGRSVEARRRQGWYLHIGSGRNIRTADLPLPYTKKMAHEFLQAPDHFTVEAALRWGQVRGLGGSKELALAIAATRLGRSFESEDFWVDRGPLPREPPGTGPRPGRAGRGLSPPPEVRPRGSVSWMTDFGSNSIRRSRTSP